MNKNSRGGRMWFSLKLNWKIFCFWFHFGLTSLVSQHRWGEYRSHSIWPIPAPRTAGEFLCSVHIKADIYSLLLTNEQYRGKIMPTHWKLGRKAYYDTAFWCRFSSLKPHMRIWDYKIKYIYGLPSCNTIRTFPIHSVKQLLVRQSKNDLCGSGVSIAVLWWSENGLINFWKISDAAIDQR